MLIHILHNGKALCGFSYLTPVNWPKGNDWTVVAEKDKSNCEACLKKLEKVFKQM